LIKEAREDRAEEILEVVNVSNLEAYNDLIPQEYFREPILTPDELLKDLKRMTFFGWEIKGKIVAVAALDDLGEQKGRVRYVYVLPGYQRQGIGTVLVRRVEELAKELGLKILKVLTVEKAHWAISFYTKLGYQLAERIQRPWGFDVFLEKEV
jgi:GNAT superfamily N-acetyltransferase